MRPHLLLSLVAVIAAHPSARAQGVTPASTVTVAPLPVGDVRAVLTTLMAKLESTYLDPAIARAYAAALRAKLDHGEYDRVTTAEDFARTVTADLQAVRPDRHLRVFAPRPAATGARPRLAGAGPDILQSGWIAPGVAYISFGRFSGDAASVAQVRAFLDAHRDARALIIDARVHHGGGADEMNALFAALCTKPTELLWLDTRVAVDSGAPFENMRPVPAPAGVVRRAHYAVPAADQGAIARAPVYVLTSRATASAAEHMALALKRTGRGTVIGETTAGAGNYGSFFDVGGGYRAFIPFGRTFDPVSGRGWEATGVAPDIAVPADRALDVVLRRIGVAANARDSLAAMTS